MDLLEEHNRQNYKMETRDYSSFDELYASITKQGSLGLLALGARTTDVEKEARRNGGGRKQDENRP